MLQQTFFLLLKVSFPPCFLSPLLLLLLSLSFFFFRGGGRAPGAPPPESAPGNTLLQHWLKLPIGLVAIHVHRNFKVR